MEKTFKCLRYKFDGASALPRRSRAPRKLGPYRARLLRRSCARAGGIHQVKAAFRPSYGVIGAVPKSSGSGMDTDRRPCPRGDTLRSA